MVGTFLLLIYPRLNLRVVNSPDNSDLINQALLESVPLIKSIWLNPASHVDTVKCALPKNVGMSYLECNPEGWQCVWDNIDQVKLVIGGNTYHIKAARKLEFVKRQVQGINESTGYIGEIEIVELNKVSICEGGGPRERSRSGQGANALSHRNSRSRHIGGIHHEYIFSSLVLST